MARERYTTNEKYRRAAAFELEASEAAADKMKREAQGIIYLWCY